MILPRRHVIGGAAALAGTATLGKLIRPAHGAVSEFRMTEAGGASGDSIEAGYIKPFTEKTGITVIRESPSGLGKLRAMVEAGNVTSALLELSSPELEQAKALDLLDPLDWDAIDPLPIFPEARDDKGFGYQFYSTIMAWHPDARAPASWSDFWDVEGFPGKRSLPDYAAYILAMAAMADGVAPADLYPIDLDRAFGKLDQIKDHVAVWWQAGAQPPQLIKDNEVQYAVAWSGRVAGEEGIRFSFEQGQLDLAFFVVPRGCDPELKAAAMGLLHEMTVPENQAVAAAIIPYTGNSVDLEPLLPQDHLDQFPTTAANRSVQVLSDARWWFENADEIELRWQEFKLSL